MAFDPLKPDGGDSGPTVVTDTRTNLVELKALIDAKIPQSGLGTYGLTPTWSATHTWDSAGIVVKRAHGGDFIIYEQKTIEAGHTSAHKMRVLATDNGASLVYRPVIDGVDTPTKQLKFDYAAEAWQIGNTGQGIWYAGNFDPTTLYPSAQLKTTKTRQKVNVLTSSAAIAVNPATSGEQFVLQLAHTATMTFTLPTGADSDLGEAYILRGLITIENITGAGAITLAATGADKIETNGSQDTTVGNVCTLAYTIVRFNPSSERRLVTFAWNS